VVEFDALIVSASESMVACLVLGAYKFAGYFRSKQKYNVICSQIMYWGLGFL